jgi:hypothetical protein
LAHPSPVILGVIPTKLLTVEVDGLLANDSEERSCDDRCLRL